MKIITVTNSFNLTLTSINKKILLLLKTKSLGVLYFFIPKQLKVKILKNNIVFDNIKNLLFLNLIQKIKTNSKTKLKKKLIIQGLGYKVYNTFLLDNSIQFKFGLSHNKVLFIMNKKIEISFF